MQAKNCRTVMHPECAGLPGIPKGDWYCREHASAAKAGKYRLQNFTVGASSYAEPHGYKHNLRPTLPLVPETCIQTYASSSQPFQRNLRIPAGKASKKAPAKPRKERASGDKPQGKAAKQPSKLKPKKQQVLRLLRPH